MAQILDQFNLPEGPVQMSYPGDLSPRSVRLLREQLRLFLARGRTLMVPRGPRQAELPLEVWDRE